MTNTAERVSELIAEISEALNSNMLPKTDGEKLRGRLQFATSQVFWQGLQTLAEGAFKPCLCRKADTVRLNTPRKIEASQAEVVHVYVDASLRPSEVQWSGGHGS